jgi:hypothetical protein
MPTARSLLRKIPEKLGSGKSSGSSSQGSSPLRKQGSAGSGVAIRSAASHDEDMEKGASEHVEHARDHAVPEMRPGQHEQPRLMIDGSTYV